MGRKGYTRINDYVDKVQEAFPEFSIEEINYILKYGCRELYKLIYKRADVFCFSKINGENIKIIFGRILFQSVVHKVRYVLRKLTIKLKILYKAGKIKWDGYYYFGLGEDEWLSYQAQMSPWFKDEIKKRKRYKNTKFNYGDVVLYKNFDECKLNLKYKYFFRVPYIAQLGHKLFKPDYSTKYAEYIAKRTLDGFENVLINEDVNTCKNVKY